MKGEFKFKNKYNLTTEKIRNKPVTISINNIVLVGVLTHVDDDYVYGDFKHNNENDIMIELNNEDYLMSMEISYGEE